MGFWMLAREEVLDGKCLMFRHTRRDRWRQYPTVPSHVALWLASEQLPGCFCNNEPPPCKHPCQQKSRPRSTSDVSLVRMLLTDMFLPSFVATVEFKPSNEDDLDHMI